MNFDKYMLVFSLVAHIVSQLSTFVFAILMALNDTSGYNIYWLISIVTFYLSRVTMRDSIKKLEGNK